MKKLNIAVLASGRGSNLQALIERIHIPERYGRIFLVVGDKGDATALEYAKNAGIPRVVVSYAEGKEKAEAAIVQALVAHNIDLIALAGFMRLLSPDFVKRFPNRVINIHPSLLPAFPGLDAQRQALVHGAKVSGCTVHFVDAGMDTGKIILQKAVPVLDNDSEASLSERILAVEHELYAAAIEHLAQTWPA
jgi:phosphoribosylglycinamide formyltransferase-1